MKPSCPLILEALLQLSYLYKAVSYGEIFSRNICPKFLPTNISPPHDLGNMEIVLRFRNLYFWVSWRGSKACRSGVTGGRKKGNNFSLVCSLCISNTVPCLFVLRMFGVLLILGQFTHSAWRQLAITHQIRPVPLGTTDRWLPPSD